MADEIFFIFSKSAERDLGRLDIKTRLSILKKLRWYSSIDDPMDAAEPIRDDLPITHRFRVGGWRILGIWLQREQKFLATEIKRRGQAYKKRKR